MDIDSILGDLTRWIGDRTRAGITHAFGVPGENHNGRSRVEFCAERELRVGNTLSTGIYISTQGIKT